MRGSIGKIIGFTTFAMASIVVTALIWNTLQNNIARGDTTRYSALFHDVSGLHVNDHVRVAGVRVGKVEEIELDGTDARVTFSVQNDQAVYQSTTVAVRYQNLLGQRYLSLEAPDGVDDEQDPDDTIEFSRTRDSLDLSRLLNGFQPIFDLLEPEDINQLAGSLIKAFDGQRGAIDFALNEIAELAVTFADRDQVVGAIIDNLTPVLTEFADSGTAYRELLDQSQRLVTGLVRQRHSFGEAVTGISELIGAVTDLTERARVPITRAVGAANQALGLYAANRDVLERILARFPAFIEDLGRTAQHGSWIDLYPCHIDGAAPFLLVPNGLLSDLGGHHHTEVCER